MYSLFGVMLDSVTAVQIWIWRHITDESLEPHMRNLLQTNKKFTTNSASDTVYKFHERVTCHHFLSTLCLVTAKLYFWTKSQECERSCSCNTCWRQKRKLYPSVLSIIFLFPSLPAPLELQANVAHSLKFSRL